MRVLLSRPRPSLACAPIPTRTETVEGWLERVIAACPRAPREPEVVLPALLRAVGALEEARVPVALEVLATHGREARWSPVLGPLATALVRRTLQESSATSPAEDWRALLARPERSVRVAAASQAPVPSLAAPLVETVVTDPAWTVRRAALQRLSSATLDPGDLSRALAAGLVDGSAFVRSEAIVLTDALPDADACALLAPLGSDRDPWVAERARSVTARRCAR
jgi:hypothetical protein